MREKAEALIRITEIEAEHFEALSKEFEMGRRGLIEMKAPEIYESAARQEELILKISKVEEDRKRAAVMLGSHLGIKNRKPETWLLTGLVSGETRSRLKEKGEKLTGAVAKAERERKKNLQIISSKLSSIDKALRIIGGSDVPREFYAPGRPSVQNSLAAVISSMA
ncbi:MAG: flagellar export chaperone FlgN [Nitrospirota bacterium]